jgi:hypothetical protein
MDSIVHELPRYSAVLARSLGDTPYASDRTAYFDHLAASARWLGMIRDGASFAELRASVVSEQRRIGSGHLSAEPGRFASEAFERFVTVESQSS